MVFYSSNNKPFYTRTRFYVFEYIVVKMEI